MPVCRNGRNVELNEQGAIGKMANTNQLMNELTVKQTDFCLFYIETGNASEAYRRAYEADGMKPETINRKAAELMNNGKITARIGELQAEHRQTHNITVNDLLNELEEARKIAKENKQAGAMTQATMGKAKLLGLDKQTLEIMGALNVEQKAEIDLSGLNIDELEQLEALIIKGESK